MAWELKMYEDEKNISNLSHADRATRVLHLDLVIPAHGIDIKCASKISRASAFFSTKIPCPLIARP